MKKFFLLILSLMTLAWAAGAQPKSVNVDVTGKKLETVLNEISEQSGVFCSNAGWVKTDIYCANQSD